MMGRKGGKAGKGSEARREAAKKAVRVRWERERERMNADKMRSDSNISPNETQNEK
jgi:hypothetical protein